MTQISLLAQDYAIGYILISVTLFVGILVLCIPRPRKSVVAKPDSKKGKKKK